MPDARGRGLSERAETQARRALGRARRRQVPRGAQGEWQVRPARPDPIAILREANAERIPGLAALKMFRMAASPFAFFRGAAPVMAADLATLPRTGLVTQICGDAHVQNLGAYAAPDGHLVFDLNDFDETIEGPWEWDLKRLATSFVLAGREAGASRTSRRRAVRTLVRAYRDTLDRLAGLVVLDLLRLEITRSLQTDVIHRVLLKAERVTNDYALAKLTVRVRGGERRFHDRPPVLHHVPDRVARAVLAALGPYRETLGPDRQLAFDAYRPVDVAFKVVGTGSVGTRDFVVLLVGRGPEDSLLLQVKEALPSCYARYLPDAPAYGNQGRRVAEGQHRMQSATDPLLGWTSLGGRDFIVRQLSDHKAGLEPGALRDDALVSYAEVSGEILAKAHARTGDPAAIAGYCGRGDRLDQAILRFANAYADQTERDHARLLEAIRKREVKAASEFRLHREERELSRRRAKPAARPRRGKAAAVKKAAKVRPAPAAPVAPALLTPPAGEASAGPPA
jgi:uncharacterized protein (DUF2252 family)